LNFKINYALLSIVENSLKNEREPNKFVKMTPNNNESKIFNELTKNEKENQNQIRQQVA